MERIEPSNSVKMPAMNFGVYWITDPTECEAAVLSAWRGIDTAASYLNERAVGRAVARSGIPCSELFISTKLWVQDTSEAGAERAIRRSLELLRTDTIDLWKLFKNPCSQAELNKIVPFGFSLQRQKMVFFFAIKIV